MGVFEKGMSSDSSWSALCHTVAGLAGMHLLLLRHHANQATNSLVGRACQAATVGPESKALKTSRHSTDSVTPLSEIMYFSTLSV